MLLGRAVKRLAPQHDDCLSIKLESEWTGKRLDGAIPARAEQPLDRVAPDSGELKWAFQKTDK